MSIIRDIVDFSNAVQDYDSIDAISRMKKHGSHRNIYQMANEYTAVFPLFVSRNAKIETGMMVGKSIERDATSMLRLVLAANQIQDVNNLGAVLSKYHTNLRLSSTPTVNDILDISDVIEGLDEGTAISDLEYISFLKEHSTPETTYECDNYNETPIKDILFTLDKKEYGKYIVEAKSNVPKKDFDKMKNQKDDQISYLRGEVNKKSSSGGSSSSSNKMSGRDMKDYADFMGKNVLLDNDVKKANELIPTLFQVNMIYVDKAGNNVPMSFIIGVKVKIYPMESNEIIDHIVSKNKDMNNFAKFIRATTKEIAFVKDFLFAVDKAKKDALFTSNKGSVAKAWRILEHLAQVNKFKRMVGLKNNALAISSLLITAEEVDYIEAQHNMDLYKESVAAPVVRGYNLLSLIIADESAETCSFLFDEHSPLYETISYKGLEKEAQKNDKQLLNIIGKMAR